MAQHVRPARRFRDPALRIYDLVGQGVDVVCPRCERRARVAVHCPGRATLSCAGCAYVATWPGTSRVQAWGGPIDPYFWQPLWLRAGCAGHTLWAFNRQHLDILAEYVGAGLRERGPAEHAMTMVARLPAWIKTAKHRAEVLKVLDRLRHSLDSARPTSPAGSGLRPFFSPGRSARRGTVADAYLWIL